MGRRRKKSVPKRIVAFLKKGSLHFSLSPTPISFSVPVNALSRKKKTRRAKIPVLVPTEIIQPQSSFPLATRNPQTNINPIQRESLPMIAEKIAEAKAIGRKDLVIGWSMIEYAVRNPRKARRTLKEILDALSGY